MSTDTLTRTLLGVGLATALVLLVPAIAMQFSTEVNWGAEDFLAAAALLFCAGAAMAIGWRRTRSPALRTAITSAIALCLALVWAELAVGLFH